MVKSLISRLIFCSKPARVATEASPNVYESIYVLTLDKFIDCLCDAKLKVLELPGKKASPQELSTAWQKIYEQYAECVQDSEQKYMTRLTKEINLLGTKLNLVNLILDRLSTKHSPEVLSELKKILNVPGKFDPNDGAQYKKDLGLAVSLSKQLFVKMKEKEAELQRLMPTAQEAGRINRSHFDSLLIQLSKHLKFQVNRRQVFVSEFIAMMADMRAAYDQFLKDQKTLKP